MNKSLITNLSAALVTVAGYYCPSAAYSNIAVTAGLFALSGGITNWLAVHMLFEKVPLCYGSGVIPNQFEEFKGGIKRLIIEEFFTREHIERFFADADISADAISGKIDFDHVFNSITDAIEESSLGNMLAMVGGKQALAPLKEPIIEKLKGVISELAAGDTEKNGDNNFTQGLIEKVEHIIDSRLEELTPQKVKEIIQDMIHKHLGWLVVWGGVFGGLIGLAVALAQ